MQLLAATATSDDRPDSSSDHNGLENATLDISNCPASASRPCPSLMNSRSSKARRVESARALAQVHSNLIGNYMVTCQREWSNSVTDSLALMEILLDERFRRLRRPRLRQDFGEKVALDFAESRLLHEDRVVPVEVVDGEERG